MEASVSYHGYFRRLVGPLHLARTVVQSRRPVLWRVIPPHDESVYPGADTARTFERVLLGAGYGFVDGAIVGYLFAVLCGLFTREHRSAQEH
jgi:hypothetical protein